jgi:hypothetical protein
LAVGDAVDEAGGDELEVALPEAAVVVAADGVVSWLGTGTAISRVIS